MAATLMMGDRVEWRSSQETIKGESDQAGAQAAREPAGLRRATP